MKNNKVSAGRRISIYAHAVNKASNLKLGALVGHYQQDVWRLDGACGCRDDNQRWEEHCAASSVEDTIRAAVN